jgi:ABC-type glycerol-3-phosphate transport system permease component
MDAPRRLTAAEWLRFHGWRPVVHLLLITLGVLNIYPFLWMEGTSFKSTSEAGGERHVPYPRLKYYLSGALPRKLPEELNTRQLETLDSLRLGDQGKRESQATFIPSSVNRLEYSGKYKIGAEQAQDELNQLVALRLMRTQRLQPVNYKVVWEDMSFSLATATSVMITITVVFFSLMMSAMLGYALVRLRFPGKMLILTLMIVATVAPREATIVPIFRMLQSLGLLDGLWGMVLWMTSHGIIGNAFLMAGYFWTLPVEVEEAAAVDGAGRFQTFFDVTLPMARPIVLALGLLTFIGAWNDFMVPYLCTVSAPQMQPLAVAVYTFQKGYQGYWELFNAATAIMIVPVIVLFLIFQKHIVQSIAVGAVKG